MAREGRDRLLLCARKDETLDSAEDTCTRSCSVVPPFSELYGHLLAVDKKVISTFVGRINTLKSTVWSIHRNFPGD